MTAHPAFTYLDRPLLRVAHGTLLDFPLLPEPGASVWTATLWPDVRNAGTWGRASGSTAPSIHPPTPLTTDATRFRPGSAHPETRVRLRRANFRRVGVIQHKCPSIAICSIWK